MRHPMMILCALVACSPSEPLEPAGGDTGLGEEDTDEPQPCLAMLQDISPADATTNVPTDTVVDVFFSEPPLDGEWAVGIAGVDGTATLDETATIATFVPDAPLAYETTYTVEARACQNTANSSFTTVGEPLDTTILDGRTFELPYSDLVWQAPNAASILATYIDFDSFLIQVDDVDETTETISVFAAVGYAINGTMTPDCGSLFSPGTGDFSSNPMFTAGPDDMQLPLGATTDLTIEDFALRASFNADGTEIQSITFAGLADTRPVDTLIGSNTCTMAALFGDTCVPCSDGVKKCLQMIGTATQADWNAAIDLIGECP